jgi:putative FmdB family regulatory protein
MFPSAEVHLPRYDYECETCHHRFELRQGFDSEPVATCPECENKASRKFHSVPIVFKGSGWYVNDYGKRGGAKTSTSDSSDGKESDSESKAATKSESKDSSTGSAKSESTTKSSPKSESTAKAKSD